ncbi:MAG: hypothetical protein JWM33_2684 [Caulobacteraceae bacterium]|nr:hypothetical protein [Caulobacteraceae bacterium]
MQRLLAAALVLAAIGPSVPVLAAAAAPAAPAAPAAAAPPPVLAPIGVSNGKAGDVIFFEDFAGPTIDRSRWNVVVTGATISNNEQQTYIDSPDVLSIVTGANAEGAANALQIKPVFREGYTNPAGRKADFVSGRMNTLGKVEFTYGSVAARIKLSAGKGLWPAWWTMGNAGAWPTNGEIDIMENAGDPGWTSVAMHGPGYSGATPIGHTATLSPDTDTTNWHVYSVDWTRDAVIFRTDGVEHYRANRTDVEKYGVWMFDNQKYLLLNLALGGQYPQGRNKTPATAPYPGIPAETVDLIKSGKGRMLIDWIKVTKLP